MLDHANQSAGHLPRQRWGDFWNPWTAWERFRTREANGKNADDTVDGSEIHQLVDGRN